MSNSFTFFYLIDNSEFMDDQRPESTKEKEMSSNATKLESEGSSISNFKEKNEKKEYTGTYMDCK